MARARVAEEEALQAARETGNGSRLFPVPDTAENDEAARGWIDEGRAASAVAADLLVAAGFEIRHRNRRVAGLGLQVSVVAEDQEGERWYFDVTGAFTSTPAGLVAHRHALEVPGPGGVLAARDLRPLVLLSSHLPPRRSAGDRALRAGGPGLIHDVVGVGNGADRERLAQYARGGHRSRPLPGFWTAAELGAAR